MADSVDELFEVRTMFWLGAYQQAITAANKCKPKNGIFFAYMLVGMRITFLEQDKIQRDVYVYRSYLALNQPALVTGEINDKSPLQLQAVISFLNGNLTLCCRSECLLLSPVIQIVLLP